MENNISPSFDGCFWDDDWLLINCTSKRGLVPLITIRVLLIACERAHRDSAISYDN